MQFRKLRFVELHADEDRVAVFAADLELGQKICRLPAGHMAAAFAMTAAGAILSALAAAWRATHVEPAEAIRVE